MCFWNAPVKKKKYNFLDAYSSKTTGETLALRQRVSKPYLMKMYTRYYVPFLESLKILFKQPIVLDEVN